MVCVFYPVHASPSPPPPVSLSIRWLDRLINIFFITVYMVVMLCRNPTRSMSLDRHRFAHPSRDDHFLNHRAPCKLSRLLLASLNSPRAPPRTPVVARGDGRQLPPPRHRRVQRPL
ncbi:hypothetical protein LshimejAT787_0905920 [Lyophyllum shimeji]|uniref:Uncharacterized protein n=1 Tax=Lyophyllum shimeji TaxID=47721 RepID=A0A9P3PRG2_LYOSH|nr:hypothetical protein LshimejAT787_0905920 [Lyophyllum shimeji]